MQKPFNAGQILCIYWSFSVIQFERETNDFQPSFGDNSAICWSILMQDTVLERLLVVDYMTEIWI
jgi:hypothetical protein